MQRINNLQGAHQAPCRREASGRKDKSSIRTPRNLYSSSFLRDLIGREGSRDVTIRMRTLDFIPRMRTHNLYSRMRALDLIPRMRMLIFRQRVL